jgi:putative oligomerization/nucleic acid binding protein
MPLLRGIAKTAAAAGAAKAVSHRVSGRQGGRWAAKNQEAAQPEADQKPPPQDDMNAKLGQLKQLGELKNQGVISDAEFAEQKRKILG